MSLRASLMVLMLAFCGCPRAEQAPAAPTAECTAVGPRCLFSPGKLGVCGPAAPDTCDEPPCFECVDQH